MEGVNVYYNQMEKKWAANFPGGVEFYENRNEALKEARKIAKEQRSKMFIHKSEEDIKERDYTEA